MIDDEKLQELLTKASSLYHNGDYKTAISSWQEALTVDPSNQKAREGIRMATLLLGDWEPPAAPEAPAPGSEAPADGAEVGPEGASAEEMEARLDLGVARVRQLLAERKYSDALEGARGLLPIGPESEQVRQILEEAQQAFESAPFIEEHLTLARELLAQGRNPEAEAECRKVFALDGEHPGAHQLLAEIQGKTQNDLKRAASQLGGMTVKLNVDDLKKLTPQPEGLAPAPPGLPPDEPAAGEDSPFEIDGSGAEAAKQEEVAARALLDAAFELEGEDQPAPAPRPGADEIIEAKTKVAPSVRIVASAPPRPAEAEVHGPAEKSSSAGAKPAAAAGASGARAPSAAAKPAPGKPAPGAKPTVSKPARPRIEHPGSMDFPMPETPPPADAVGAGQAKASAAATKSAGKGQAAADKAAGDTPDLDLDALGGAASWEAELAQLNLKQGEHDILKGSKVKAEGVQPAPQVDEDLMALLDTGMDGMGERPATDQVESIPLAAPGAAAVPEEPAAGGSKKAAKTFRKEPLAGGHEEPLEEAKPRPRAKLPAPPPLDSRSSLPRYFALLGVLLLAGGAAGYWYFFKPALAGGAAGSPQRPAPPPAAEMVSGPAMDGGGSAIPTPMGTNRQSAEGGQGASIEGPAAAAAAAPAPAPAVAPAPAGSLTVEQIKPEEPAPLSPEEKRRKVANFIAAGQRLMEQGRWREARAQFGAALALDPVNFELKELLDASQARVDEERKLMDEFDSSKKMFADKDYQNALWKLYRLPRDKGLGNIDLFIRNAWFNWAVVSLKGGDATDALQKLSEVLALDPQDEEALRLQEIAERYSTRAKDRIFYNFTDTLKLRTFDQR